MHQSAGNITPTLATGIEWISKPVKEVAELIGISERFLWTLIKDGEIDSFKSGRIRLITRAEAQAYVAREIEKERAARVARTVAAA